MTKSGMPLIIIGAVALIQFAFTLITPGGMAAFQLVHAIGAILTGTVFIVLRVIWERSNPVALTETAKVFSTLSLLCAGFVLYAVLQTTRYIIFRPYKGDDLEALILTVFFGVPILVIGLLCVIGSGNRRAIVALANVAAFLIGVILILAAATLRG